jgi:5-methylcytosine-specific restriction endonuclease McrA
MKQAHVYILDLTKITGKGDFLCPRCGNKISPDDTTEEIYSILEARVNSCCLEELLICCNRCESEIHLIGFDTIQKLLEVKDKILTFKKNVVAATSAIDDSTPN